MVSLFYQLLLTYEYIFLVFNKCKIIIVYNINEN